ncbi:hypothetical protein [Exiguobacterium sp. 8H]|uniref:hypothetical protein n=1 Tax=Exiguobacterium sp. 8H TaxID=2653140 RepID=UPI00135996FB|nr:hypothetical protein [Exiguobacterium sp. 8H]
MRRKELRHIASKGFGWYCSCGACRAEHKSNKQAKNRLFRRRMRQRDRMKGAEE